MNTRRDALKALILAAAASHSLNAQHEHDAPALVQLKTPAKPIVFTTAELALTATVTDLIIPRSDTPGASDVGVPLIFDIAASRSSSFKERWLDGLAWLNEGRDFASLSHAEQVAILTPVSMETTTRGGKFFKLLKDSTVDAYYSTQQGLTVELGWHGNTFLKEFKGCTHPEHQV